MSTLRAALLLALGVPATANAQFVIDYETNRFCSSQGSMTLNGAALFVGGSPNCHLQTTTGWDAAGSGWYSTPFDITTRNTLTTRFEFSLGGGSLAGSGLTFTLQGAGTTAIGGGGGNLGYSGISPSVSVELDAAITNGTNDPNDNHVGVDVNGSLTSTDLVTPGIDLNSGGSIYVWVEMDVPGQTVDVYMDTVNVQPVSPTLSATGVDLASLGTTVYAGFTSGAWQYYYYGWYISDTALIRSWYFDAGEPDSDGDGVPDSLDVCPGFDDAIDSDGDGVPTGCDNCPSNPNALQDDFDGDLVGDACDTCPLDNPDDSDGDTVCDSNDVCAGFDDTIDGDGDLIPDACDNCPGTLNGSQTDADGDGAGDACDSCPYDALDDSDGDGSCDSADLCPGFDDTADADGDFVPDGCDVCPGADDVPDADLDGNPDCLDPCPADPLDDSDGDGSCDSVDLCPGFDDAVDPDGDGNPTGCDPCPNDILDDSDGDGSCDSTDICPGQDDFQNSDGDLAPDCLDPCPNDYADDSDADGSCDSDDICPGEDDFLDTDGDTTPDCLDACPTDPTGDDDGDTVCNQDDVCPGFNDLDDYDGDGIPNGCDDCVGVPIDADGDGVADPCDLCQGYDDYADADGDLIPDACDQCPSVAYEGDLDGDGFVVCLDCNDQDFTVFPGAYGEQVADGIDQDCDGSELCYEDLDGDGFGTPVIVELVGTDCAVIAGGSDNDQDCDDADPDAWPGAPEIAFNGLDEDCDGYVDEDDPTTGTGTGTGTATGSPGTDSTRDWAPDDTVVDDAKVGAVGCGCSSSGSVPVAGWLVLLGLVRRRYQPQPSAQ